MKGRRIRQEIKNLKGLRRCSVEGFFSSPRPMVTVMSRASLTFSSSFSLFSFPFLLHWTVIFFSAFFSPPSSNFFHLSFLFILNYVTFHFLLSTILFSFFPHFLFSFLSVLFLLLILPSFILLLFFRSWSILFSIYSFFGSSQPFSFFPLLPCIFLLLCFSLHRFSQSPSLLSLSELLCLPHHPLLHFLL